jgi:predicted TPR repeat methyltransferase
MDVECSVQWVDDRLPNLSRLRAKPDRYAFILCSAVLMHIQPADLGKSFAALADLLAPSGLVAISVRSALPGEPRQVFHDHEASDVVAAAQISGLHVIAEDEVPDTLGRSEVRWRTLVFGRQLKSRKSA